MKKIILALLAFLVLAGGALILYQNRPTKQFSRHLIKARLFVRQANYAQAIIEYEKAYNATGKYTPYVSLEVLKLTNQMALQEKKIDLAMENTRNLLLESPGSEEGRFILAQLAFQVGQLEPAFEALNSLLSSNATHFGGRLLLAQVRTKQGQSDLAEEQLRLLASAHPDSQDIAIPLIQNLMGQRKYADSRLILKALLAKNPKDTVAQLLLVEGWLKERQADSASAALDAWQKIDSNVTQPIAIQKSRIASIRGDLIQALEILAPYAKETKPTEAVLSEIALIQVKLGQLDSALKKYDQILSQSPKNKGSYLLLTHLIQLAAKNPVRALEILKTLEVGVRDRVFQRSLIATYLSIGQENKIAALLAAEPDSSRPALEAFRMGLVPNAEFIGGWALFNYYQMNEQPYWMLKTLDSLYKRWPTNGLISRSYAAQLSAVGALPQALSIMNGIHGPTREDDFRMLELNRRLGRDQDALKIAHSMEKKYPQARGINAIISDIHLAKGENDKAILYALNELALDKENIICINNLAWIHGVINHDLAKAQPYLKRLEEMKNGDPRVLDTIGWILANSEQGPEAESYFKLALNISPNNPTLLYHFAWQQYKHGDKAKAADLVTKALALNRPFTEKSEAQKLLADLN